MYDKNRARFESQLAIAHRALFNAGEAAEALNEQGALDDLIQLLGEVTRIADDSASGRKRRPSRHLKLDPVGLAVRN